MKRTSVLIGAALTVAVGVAACSGGGDSAGTGASGGDSVALTVTAGVTESVGTLGALQFDLVHTGESGAWEGQLADVACTWLVSGGVTACNGRDGGKEVSCALAAVGGFSTPSPIISCTFNGPSGTSPGDFRVNVVDASTPKFDRTPVEMAVTEVKPAA